MVKLKENVNRLNILLKEGKIAEAFEKYYNIAFVGNGDVSVTEWEMNIENKEGIKKIIYRVNVQHWKEDKIINEKIYFCGDQKFKVED